MSYKAYVCRITSIRPIEGCDRIQIGSAAGYQVIIGKDIQNGQLVLFFESDGQLSEEYTEKNDLVRRKNPDGSPAGGMFEPNRKVKAIKLRGARSDGFAAPLETLRYTGFDISKLKEGDQFDELKGHKICQKFETTATRNARSNKTSNNSSRNVKMFAKHIETEQFRRSINLIPVGSIIYVSAKMHGTSQRRSHCLDDIPIKRNRLFHWVAKKFKRPMTERRWVHLDGTRNTILQKYTGPSYYGDEGFRIAATKNIILKKGECIYGELVGYTETGQPIMARQSTKDLKDKSVSKKFGDTITYTYKCIEGQCDLYIYRITQVNEDGYIVELSWPQVVSRCKELGLKTVPVLDTFIYDGDQEKLLDKVNKFVEGNDGLVPDIIDPSHPLEGVVLRVESEHGFAWYKAKSNLFGILEGYLKEKDDYVDIEESS